MWGLAETGSRQRVKGDLLTSWKKGCLVDGTRGSLPPGSPGTSNLWLEKGKGNLDMAPGLASLQWPLWVPVSSNAH